MLTNIYNMSNKLISKREKKIRCAQSANLCYETVDVQKRAIQFI